MAKRPRKKRRPLRTVFFVLLAAVLAAVFVRWDNTALQTTYFEPAFSSLPEGFDGCRIVVLSDLHGAVFGQENAPLFSAVAEADVYKRQLFILSLLSLFDFVP